MTRENIGVDVTSVLGDVRTVLSRAETALGRHNGTDFHRYDPDGEEMAEALREVVRLLAPYRRTGRVSGVKRCPKQHWNQRCGRPVDHPGPCV